MIVMNVISDRIAYDCFSTLNHNKLLKLRKKYTMFC